MDENEPEMNLERVRPSLGLLGRKSDFISLDFVCLFVCLLNSCHKLTWKVFGKQTEYGLSIPIIVKIIVDTIKSIFIFR